MRPLQNSLARRMVALILLGAGLVVLAVLAYSHFSQRKRLIQHAVLQADTLATSVVGQIESKLGRAEATVRQTALSLNPSNLNRQHASLTIRRTLEDNPNLLGMAIALTPSHSPSSDFKILYGWQTSGKLSVTDRPEPEADYQTDWFTTPVEFRKPTWNEPYYDLQADSTMVTYSVPILHQNEVIGVATCDLSLAGIRNSLKALDLGKDGMAALLSRKGTFIAHPDHSFVEQKETIFTLANSQPIQEVRDSITELGHRMLSGKPGHMAYLRPFADGLRVAHMNYTTVPSTGWALGIFRPEREVLAPLVHLNKISAIVAVASLSLLLIPALAIAWSVSKPIHALVDATQSLALGNFDASLPHTRRDDEVARLTMAFDKMRHDLKHYIDDLTTTTAAKERMAGELSAAREIQMSIVPKLFPPLPNRPDIDLYAMLIPALEVGGDLYDFGLLDDDHLYLAIGDVSGKGIPASLLMAVGKTLLKSTVQAVRTPGRALAHVNNELAEDNESCMFITMFCAVLNLKTGDLIYANAGHNPPLIARTSGSSEWLDEPPSAALGARTGVSYQNHRRRLNPGDLLVFYTDGVTEAMSPAYEMFGDDRLLSFTSVHKPLASKPFLEALAKEIHAHANGAPQSDDITALVVRVRDLPSPDSPTQAATEDRIPDASLTLRNHLDDFPQLVAWIEELADTLVLPNDLVSTLNLALEEWVVNVILYAYEDDQKHSIELKCWRDTDEVRLTIEDDGKPFDPTSLDEVDTSLAIEDRPIGGLGIHFIRKTMDRFTYRRHLGKNCVTMAKSITPASPGKPAAAC